jgi:pimeloyl-ACP methyl ester carboxylesterase
VADAPDASGVSRDEVPEEVVMNVWLALALLLGPRVFPSRPCPVAGSFAANPPEEVRRPLNSAYDPETLRTSYGAQLVSVCPPQVVTSNTPCSIHRVYRPGLGQDVREPLVVLLPGSGMEADRHNFVLQTAAYAGYRTIGLSYDNTGPVESQCAAAADCLDCYGQARDEIITGNDARHTNLTVVQRSDSIVERLHNLLRGLEADDLADGTDDDHWGDFYNTFAAGTPPPNSVAVHTLRSIEWDKIILVGFSQGAGHAARIAQQKQVHGLFLIDGGNDTCGPGAGQPANWYAAANASLGRPSFGVTHRRGVANWAVPATWLALGFPSSFDDFDDNLIPLAGPAAVGITDQDPLPNPDASPETPNRPCTPPNGNPHTSMGKDGCMPTTATSAVAAATADAAYLFGHYLARFCYACDELTCP